jgi:TP901 family phage tail tape measure protein
MANFITAITLQFKDAFSAGFKSASDSFAGMKGALDDIGKNQSMNSLAAGLAMATSMTDPFRQKLSALMDEPSKLAGQFDSSMRNIQSLTGESEESLQKLGKTLLGIGSNAVAGPNAVADAYYNIASGIGNVEARLPAVEAAVKLAESGQADLGAATSGLIAVVNAYNTPAENMSDLSDVFFQTVKKGVGSLDGFVSAMSSISGLSASVGVGFDELGSSMAFLTAKGQTESVAATQLKAAMVALMRPNKELSTALKSIGISSGSAMLEQYGLAESLAMVKRAVGGSQDAMAKALGSVEALQGAIALTADDYSSFAATYAGGLSGATAQALEAQTQSYESKVAKLQAANDALKIQIGDDINSIKGFFVDMGAGFLSHVVSPIMSSPIGGVFQMLAAGAGLAAKGILDMGGVALNTASQLVTLTATLQNAGGFAKLFGSSFSLISQPFKLVGGAALKAIPSIIAFGASIWTALAPLLPFIAIGVALAAVGVLLYKNWNKVKEFFTGAFTKIQGLLAGVSNKVLAVVAVFFPFIGIPALIIKNWETIKAFFVGLWIRITTLFKSAIEGIKSALASMGNFFVGIWTVIKDFFASVWNGMVNIVVSVANWFSGVWQTVTGAFAAAWNWVKDLFASVWEGIKGIVMGFVEWLSPVIDAIIAPFKAIGDVIGGIIGSVKGWFGETVEIGKNELAKSGENKAQTAAAKPVEGSVTATSGVPQSALSAPSLTTTSAVSVPEIGGGKSGEGSGGGNSALLAEHMAAASRKGISGTVSTAASDAFMGAGRAPQALNIADFSEEARTAFPQAARQTQTATVQTPWNTPEAKSEKRERPHFTIQNLTVQCDDIKKVIDFYELLEMAAAGEVA